MIKMCVPFKGCKPSNMSQGFHSGHQANDWASTYGTFIVAPFNAKVANVVSASPLSNSVEDLRRGYGVRLISTEDPTVSMSFWHCLPFFPVQIGDFVLQGQPIAQMGNSGWVEAGGKYVEIDIRTVPPYPGTHVHISMGQVDSMGNYTALDYSRFIDYSIPIKYDVFTAIKSIWQKISNLLNKK